MILGVLVDELRFLVEKVAPVGSTKMRGGVPWVKTQPNKWEPLRKPRQTGIEAGKHTETQDAADGVPPRLKPWTRQQRYNK